MAGLTTNIIPKASDARTLVDGFTTATTVATPGSDTVLVSQQGIREAITTASGLALLKDGSVALTANWDAGSYTITALRFVSDQTTGTAPFTVASTTVVANLNADLLDGVQGSSYLQNITGEAFDSLSDVAAITEAQGQIIYYDGSDWNALAPGDSGKYLKTQGAAADPIWATPAGGGDLLADGSVPLTANWDVGAYTITGLIFVSDQATGTAPFTVASTTVCTNLNADTVDGVHAATILQAGGGVALSASWDVGAYTITALTFVSDQATGTAPFTVASETMVDNLNADTVDGVEAVTMTRRAVCIDVFAAATAVSAGDGAFYWPVPALLNGYNLVLAHVHHVTASTDGATTTQIYNLTQTADMLSTEITVDQDEYDSLTAATPPVIDAGEDDLATGDVLRIDVDGAGVDTEGLQLRMEFQLP